MTRFEYSINNMINKEKYNQTSNWIKMLNEIFQKKMLNEIYQVRIVQLNMRLNSKFYLHFIRTPDCKARIFFERLTQNIEL